MKNVTSQFSSIKQNDGMIWNMKRIQISGMGKFISGVVVGAVVFSGSAIAVNSYVSDNTPENGYLLCANIKTKAVTFPNKLSCPSGTKALDMGAVTGVEGPQGPEGPQGYTGAQGPMGYTGAQGPAGVSTGSINYYKTLSQQDVVVDGAVTEFSKAKVFIAGIIKPSDLPRGYYKLNAHLSGLWSDTVFNLSSKPFVKCNFQEKKDYDAGSGGGQYGAGKSDYVNWTGINLSVQGYAWFLSPTDDPIYLVCRTTAIIKQFGGIVDAFSADTSIKMKD
jgi:hypothetical protein